MRRRVTINMSETEYAKLDTISSERGMSINDLVHTLIRKYLLDKA